MNLRLFLVPVLMIGVSHSLSAAPLSYAARELHAAAGKHGNITNPQADAAFAFNEKLGRTRQGLLGEVHDYVSDPARKDPTAIIFTQAINNDQSCKGFWEKNIGSIPIPRYVAASVLGAALFLLVVSHEKKQDFN